MALSQELLDEILDNLDENSDRKTLQNCALAGRCLLPRSRSRLFSHIVFDDYRTPSRLRDLPVNNIAPYVQKVVFLRIGYNDPGADMTSAAIPAVLASLTNLKDLAFHGHRITPAALRSFSVISSIDVEGLNLNSISFSSSAVAFRFLSFFTSLRRFSSNGLDFNEPTEGRTFTHRASGSHFGKMSVEEVELSSLGNHSKMLLLDEFSPICLCHLRTLDVTLTQADLVLSTLRELLHTSGGSLTELRIGPSVSYGQTVARDNNGLPLRLEHLERIFITMTRPKQQQSLLQWLSHAYSGVKWGNLEQLYLTIFLSIGASEETQTLFDVRYWRDLDAALSLNSVPDLRLVHVRLEAGRYNRDDAMSIVVRVRDSIRSACKALEERRVLSFELDAGM